MMIAGHRGVFGIERLPAVQRRLSGREWWTNDIFWFKCRLGAHQRRPLLVGAWGLDGLRQWGGVDAQLAPPRARQR
jgi:hypothetical protein